MMNFKCALTIRSETTYLAILRRWVGAAAKVAGFGKISKAANMACTLALIEAVDNAIFHAHGRDRKIPIRILISVGENGISIEVADRGGGIGRHALARPDEMISHGRGLFLIHRLMTKVESRLRNGSHILRMTYEFQRAHAD